MKKHHDAIYKAKAYIEKDFREHHPLRVLAREAGVNECTLKREFKEIFGRTLYQYLIELRLEHGRQLLLETNWTIGHIADACGYSTPGHFSALFKRRFGLKPFDFRQTNKTDL